MPQQTFSVEQHPRVVLQQVQGNVIVRSWQDSCISVRVEGDVPIAAQLYQEGDTVFIQGIEHNLELVVPYIKKGFFGHASLLTDISVTDADGSIVMENAGNVELERVRQVVDLTHVARSIHAASVAELRGRKGIGANVTLVNVESAEMGAVGGSVNAQQCGSVKTSVIGGNLQAERIETFLQASAVGGNCTVLNSRTAEVFVGNIGGRLNVQGIARMPSCNVGGNIDLATDLLPGSAMHLIAGGNAVITLPEQPNVHLRILSGNRIRGDVLDRQRNYIANVTLGDGSAKLSVTAGGSVTLQKGNVATVRFEQNEPVQDTPEVTPAGKRQTILQMVADGRISPEEGNALLDALEYP
jgi:hypothetical protein